MIELSKEEIQQLKGQAFLLQKDKEHFACRIHTIACMATADEALAIAQISKKHGDGNVNMTQRGCLEISGIKYENIENVKKELADAGLKAAGTGARVRPIVTCKGTYCSHGLIDTQQLCKELNDAFFARPLPHKLKINICGCVNNCTKIQQNDIGIMPFKGAYKLFIGGKHGRSVRHAVELENLVAKEDLNSTINKFLIFFEKNGQPKERIGETLERLGKTPDEIL